MKDCNNHNQLKNNEIFIFLNKRIELQKSILNKKIIIRFHIYQ